MQDLQEVTHDLHYENFRAQRLKQSGLVIEVFDKKSSFFYISINL